jgi:Fe-S-cluster-containing dehydrogenase component
VKGAEARAGFQLDLDRCVGCGSCVLACRLENGLPRGVSWRRILTLNDARNPQGPTYHFSVACHHCLEPVCLQVCPSGAYEQRPDGTVYLVEDRCLGCRYCEMACPFGAPSFDAERGIMTKCHFCAPRRERGGDPACVEACPTGALSLLEEGTEEEDADRHPGVVTRVPGFFDPALCEPMLRFRTPGGAIRRARNAGLLRRLEEVEAAGAASNRGAEEEEKS